MNDRHTFEETCTKLWTTQKMVASLGDKKLLLTPINGAWLLRQLGLLDERGHMPRASVKKFQQVNHLLQLLVPKFQKVMSQNRVVRLLDACCGSSYLTLAAAWYFHEHAKHPAIIIGIDSNQEVITASQNRAKAIGYESFLKFQNGWVTHQAWEDSYAALFPEAAADKHKLNILVALHACDTATDHALSLALRHKVNLVAVAPCCQAELAAYWQKSAPKEHPMRVVFQTPNLRREVGAQCTDAMRALLTQACGYETTVTEFIASEHTPKNRLIMGERRQDFNTAALDDYQQFRQHCAAPDLSLAQLLQEHATVFTRGDHGP